MEPEPVAADPALLPSTVPTRRGFLMAGVTFLLGTTAGGWWGYSEGLAVAAVHADEGDELAPTGDPDLDELRRLAVRAPIEELLQQRLLFLASMSRDYRGDRVLWRGFDRLVDVALHGSGVPDDRLLGRLLAQTIEYGDPDFRRPRIALAPQLRLVR